MKKIYKIMKIKKKKCTQFLNSSRSFGNEAPNAKVTGKGMQSNLKMVQRKDKNSQLLGMHGNQKQRKCSVM